MLRVLELFCGIGGCASALADRAEIVAAIDINQLALQVYRHNFTHPTLTRTIESVTVAELAAFAADLWWMSPPCQPFTAQGRRRDESDPRAASFLALLTAVTSVRPRFLGLENVPEFAQSQAHARLQSVLGRLGYQVIRDELCASQFGLPQRRRRFYLVASRDGELQRRDPGSNRPSSLAKLLDPPTPGPRFPEDERLRSFVPHLHLITRDDLSAMTHCFTAAYGRSPLRSGSYLRGAHDQPQHFSPDEMLRLFGFPATYRLPPSVRPRQAWSLIGNSLAVPAVRAVLSHLPGLAGLTTVR